MVSTNIKGIEFVVSIFIKSYFKIQCIIYEGLETNDHISMLIFVHLLTLHLSQCISILET